MEVWSIDCIGKLQPWKTMKKKKILEIKASAFKHHTVGGLSCTGAWTHEATRERGRPNPDPNETIVAALKVFQWPGQSRENCGRGGWQSVLLSPKTSQLQRESIWKNQQSAIDQILIFFINFFFLLDLCFLYLTQLQCTCDEQYSPQTGL